ncbi:MAG TPA: PIG-L family deacetylase [Bryobacteraceae bacterium]|nr:PIG-L family deacetylase [Bryobacteraceae bacterium]
MRRTILLLGSHPDDETTAAPLLLKYTRAGHAVHIVSITGGQKGVRPHAGVPAGEALAEVRAQEFSCSARTLGAEKPFLLGYEDQGIAPLEVFWDAMHRVRAVVNEVRPDVILTWGPDGITGHVDHRVTSNLATVIFQERRLLTCDPKKLYFFAFPESVVGSNANPLARKHDFLLVNDCFITTVVDCSETLEEGLRSIDCHRSQFRPERMQELKAMYRELLGGKIYLRLALSTAGWPGERERCILDGLG